MTVKSIDDKHYILARLKALYKCKANHLHDHVRDKVTEEKHTEKCIERIDKVIQEFLNHLKRLRT